MGIPLIKVGIMAEKEIFLSLTGDFLLEGFATVITGKCKVLKKKNSIFLENEEKHIINSPGFKLVPVNYEKGRFVLSEVTIGIDFHWERKEDQLFIGNLNFFLSDDKIQVINEVSIEDYLMSVISSEMSATASISLLKAHAVISRSWLLAQVQKNRNLWEKNQNYPTTFRTDEELIRWYDREDHHFFDVCADDHCQRYQGITRTTTPVVYQAVTETHGEILSFEGEICDARYSKCCGGVTELFENVWEPVNHPYLQKIADNDQLPEGFSLELEYEEHAKLWIKGKPEVFCNSSDKKVLKQVLNNYDLETNDFFRWKVVYSQEELSELIRTRTGVDFGTITDLIPVERGCSGRLIKLKIVGSLRIMTIGKELEIRKTLSSSHLYSSAFIVEKQVSEGRLTFTLKGAGWGHGVGLCQIGAAVMGDKGYTYREILLHYFKGVDFRKMY